MAARSTSRPGLTRDRVLAAALALVDRHGLEALTMRSLGESLSVEAMSLYRYCPGKVDLLEGIADRVLSEIDFTERNRGWREDLGNGLRAFWRVLVAHPNAVPLMLTTPLNTPHGRASAEVMLRLIGRAGFPPPDAHRIFRILQAFVLGTALMLRVSPPVDAGSGPAEEYPLLRVALSGPGSIDRQDDFEFGLELQLDGIEAARTKVMTKRRSR